MAERKTFRLEVISPERIFYTGDAEMVELTTTEGDIGIYADHIPLTTIVAPGVMTLPSRGACSKRQQCWKALWKLHRIKLQFLLSPASGRKKLTLIVRQRRRREPSRRLKSADENINMARADLALRKSLIRLQLAEK